MSSSSSSSCSPSTVNGILRSFRTAPPSHYIIKIDEFSCLPCLLSTLFVNNYQSNVFEAGGYQWRLKLYPNGDPRKNVNGFISLYLEIMETKKLPASWKVDLNFKLFVYDQVRDRYLTIQDADGKVTHLHRLQRECGYARLISNPRLFDPSNGFIVDDVCIFGVEVFVLEPKIPKGHCTFLLRSLPVTNFTWRIDNFSNIIEAESLESPVFNGGEKRWQLVLYPQGSKNQRGHLALYLKYLADGTQPDDDVPSSTKNIFAWLGLGILWKIIRLPLNVDGDRSSRLTSGLIMKWIRKVNQLPKTKRITNHDDDEPTIICNGDTMEIKCHLKITDQLHDKHEEIKVIEAFNASTPNHWGSETRLVSTKLEEDGFLVNDTLFIEASFNYIIAAKCYAKPTTE